MCNAAPFRQSLSDDSSPTARAQAKTPWSKLSEILLKYVRRGLQDPFVCVEVLIWFRDYVYANEGRISWFGRSCREGDNVVERHLH